MLCHTNNQLFFVRFAFRPIDIIDDFDIVFVAAKKVKLKEQLAAAEANRAAAFPTKAESAGQKICK